MTLIITKSIFWSLNWLKRYLFLLEGGKEYMYIFNERLQSKNYCNLLCVAFCSKEEFLIVCLVQVPIFTGISHNGHCSTLPVAGAKIKYWYIGWYWYWYQYWKSFFSHWNRSSFPGVHWFIDVGMVWLFQIVTNFLGQILIKWLICPSSWKWFAVFSRADESLIEFHRTFLKAPSEWWNDSNMIRAALEYHQCSNHADEDV